MLNSYRSSISHIEAGRQTPCREFWQHTDKVVKADGALVSAHADLVHAAQHHEPPVMNNNPAHKPDSTPGSIQLLYLHESDGWDDEMRRRALFGLLGRAGTTAVIAQIVSILNVDEQERVLRAIVAPSRVDEKVIENFDAIYQICRRQDDILGPRAVVNTVLAQRNVVDGLLPKCSSDLRPHLLSLYSKMSNSVGGYFAELDDAGYSVYYEQARTAAHDAHDANLALYALCSMSVSAEWQRKVPLVIDLAAAIRGLGLINKANDPQLQAQARERLAYAYAVDGQQDACMGELEGAKKSLSMSTRTEYPESLAYWYDEGFIISRESHCLLQLGRPQEAAVRASEGLELYNTSRVDSYAYAKLGLSAAHLQCHEIEESARVLSEATELAARNRSARSGWCAR